MNRSNEIELPPKPEFSIRVGITGHCADKLSDANIEHLKSSAKQLLSRLREILCAISAEGAEFYSTEPPNLKLITCLADGSDQIFAEAALEFGWKINVILPYSRCDYRNQLFNDAWKNRFDRILQSRDCEAIWELDGDNTTQTEKSYQNASEMLVHASDLLVACWNGKQEGLPGGTLSVINYALALKTPIIWIPTENQTWRLLSDPLHLVGHCELKPIDWENLAQHLNRQLIPSEEASQKLTRYFKTFEPSFNPDFVWQGFLYISSGGTSSAEFPMTDPLATHGTFTKRTQHWQEEIENFQLGEIINSPHEQKLRDHFMWSDGLADHFTGLYRASYLLNYMLGFLAVVIGVSKLCFNPTSLALAVTEIIILTAILTNTCIAASCSWHRRYLDYRLIAESLRQIRFHTHVSVMTPETTENEHVPHHPASESWFNWLLRAIQRETPIPSYVVNGESVAKFQKWIKRSHFDDQMEYHKAVHETAHKIERNLKNLSTGFFLLSLIMVTLNTVLHIDAITALPIILAAAATTTSAIRAHSQFETVSKRSLEMASYLRHMSRSCEQLAVANKPFASSALFKLITNASNRMRIESTGWISAFSDKSVEIP